MSTLRHHPFFILAVAVAVTASAGNPAGAVTESNACRNSVTANNEQISVTTTATASGPAAPGGTITLSNIQQAGNIPGTVFIAGYNLGLLSEGQNNIPATVFTDIEGTNVTEGVQSTSIENIVITTTIDDPDNSPGTGDESASDGQFSVTYDDQTWTAGPTPGAVEFRQDTQYPLAPSPEFSEQGALIVRMLIGGFFKVRYACSPGTVTPPDPGTVTPIDPAAAFASTSVIEPTASCAATPISGCVEAGKASLSIDDKTIGKEKIKVKLKNLTELTTQASFGDPVTGTTSYAVCVYDQGGALRAHMQVDRAGNLCGINARPCWSAVSTKGYKYLDPAATAHGITKANLKAGAAGKGKVQAQGQNDPKKMHTSLPAGVAAALAGHTQSTVQIVSSDAGCFTATLTDVKKADGVQFKASMP